MNKKIVGFFVMTLLIATAVLPASGTLNFSETSCEKKPTIKEIFIDIGRTEDMVLSVDGVMGDIYVKYWEHVIDGVIVKGDSILLHLDIETGEILMYERGWTNIEFSVQDIQEDVFEPTDYFWKQLVCFLDEDDYTYFYTFNTQQEYPLICWEVRHTSGTTIMYDLDGNKIGEGIPAPSKGFSLSGWVMQSDPDNYQEFRQKQVYKRAEALIDHAGDHKIAHLEEILQEDDLYSFDIGTEACLSIAGILEYAREGFNGVVNVYPFTCMPSTAASAIISPVINRLGVPYLDTPYDSSFQPGREAAIRTFMYQAHQHMKRNGRKRS